ncbi:MAG: Rrf2 family transcriptional regulator [Burkholderiales bacterium]|nr:Rrf2 family transcriptional regulator [Phycisphaerae bacterium]
MITLSTESTAAVAIVSRLCEAVARDAEATIADLLAISGVDESQTWKILTRLVHEEIVTEGFDAGGYRITREPAAITVLDVIKLFEPALADDSRLIARAMRPAIIEHFRSITFAACASACPTDTGIPESADCPRSQLGLTNNQHV